MTRPRTLAALGLAAVLALLIASPVGAQVAGYVWQLAGSTITPVRTINVTSGGTFNSATGTLTLAGGGVGDGGVVAAAPLAGLGTSASPLTVRDGGVANQYLASPTATVNGTPCTLGGSCTVTAAGPPTGTASGDLTGTYPGPTVAALQGRAVATSAPATGNVLAWGGSSWAPGTNSTTVNGTSCALGSSCTITASGPPTGSASGDLSGTYPSPTVAAINGAALGTTTATAGNVLIGSGSSWITRAITGDVALLSTGASTVGALQNRLVSNAAPTNGYVLTWNGGTSQWEPQTVPATTTAPMPSASATLVGGGPITLSSTTWTTLSTTTITPTANAYVWATASSGWKGGNNSLIGMRITIGGTTGVAITQQTTGNNDPQSTAVNAISASPATAGVAVTVTLEGQLVSGPNVSVTAASLFALSVQGTGVTSGVASITGTAPITSSGGTTPAIGLALSPTGGLTSSGGSLAVSYGTTAGTSTVGNDARLNVAPSVAGGVAYDTGSAWSRTGAGTATQVLHGGTTPSFGAVALGSDVSGTLPAGNMASVGPGAGTYGALPGSGSAAITAITLDAQGRVSGLTTSQYTSPPVTALQNVSSLASSATAQTQGVQFYFLSAATITGMSLYWPTTTAAQTITCKLWSSAAGGTLLQTQTVSVSTAGVYSVTWPSSVSAGTYGVGGLVYTVSVQNSTNTAIGLPGAANSGSYGLPYTPTSPGLAGPNIVMGAAYYNSGTSYPTTPGSTLRCYQPTFTVP